MNETIIFQNKENKPTEKELFLVLGSTAEFWKKIYYFVLTKYPDGVGEWFYAGKKGGWAYRIKDKKRAIIYLLPRDKYFKVSFVFGPKATDKILESKIATELKQELKQARKYMEGRGLPIIVKDDSYLNDIEQLVEIKLGS